MEGVIIGFAFFLFLAQELLLCASSAIDRTQFPPDFLFGTSTSAYQVRPTLTYLFASKREEHSFLVGGPHTIEKSIASVSIGSLQFARKDAHTERWNQGPRALPTPAP